MIAEGFVANGVRTYVCSRKADACAATAARLSEIGECFAVPADLSTAEGIRHLAETVGARETRLHILVNNAGATWGAALGDFPESGWDKVMDINVKGPFFLTQAFLPLLEAAAGPDDPARIINIGSIDGLNVNRLPVYSYGPSKAAVHHLTRMLAAHLADRHITCNAIAPGPFPSKMMAHTLETMGDRDSRGRATQANRQAVGHGRHGHLSLIHRRRLCQRCGHSRRWRHRGSCTQPVAGRASISRRSRPCHCNSGGTRGNMAPNHVQRQPVRMEKPSRSLLIVEDDPGLPGQLRWCFEDYATSRSRRSRVRDRGAAPARARGRPAGPGHCRRDPDGVEEGFATLAEILRLAPHTKVDRGHRSRRSGQCR